MRSANEPEWQRASLPRGDETQGDQRVRLSGCGTAGTNGVSSVTSSATSSIGVWTFVVRAVSMDHLVRLGTRFQQAARFLEAAVASGLNVLVAVGRRQVVAQHLSERQDSIMGPDVLKLSQVTDNVAVSLLLQRKDLVCGCVNE